MRIALISKDMLHCGAQRAISRLSHMLTSRGHDVYVVLLTKGPIEYDCSGEIIQLDLPMGSGLLGKAFVLAKRTIELRKIKREKKIEISLSYLDTPNISNILSKGKDKVFVSVRNYGHATEESEAMLKVVDFSMRYLYKKSDGVIAVSRQIKKWLVDDYGIASNQISVIYNAYKPAQIKIDSEKPLPLEHALFYHNHDVVVSVGRCEQQKCFSGLIRAFAEALNNKSSLRLVLVGDGVKKDQLEDLTNRLGISDQVLFVGYSENPYPYVANAKMFVCSSLFEGFPNALVEAMCVGTPIVSVDCKSGPREILEPDMPLEASAVSEVVLAENGLLCPQLSSGNENSLLATDAEKELAKAILMFADDERLRQHYSRAASKRACSFSYEQCAEEHERFFVSIRKG